MSDAFRLDPTTLNGGTSSSGSILADEVDGMLLADANTHFEISQFYFLEADFLDDGRFADWLEMLAEDLHYWAPIRSNRLRRQQALSIAAPGESAFYDETKDSLAWRIRRYDSGMAWAEDPPSRTRHLTTNISVRQRSDGLLQSRSNFLVYRNRLHTEVDLYAGSRVDILRPEGVHGYQVVKRTILFEQNVLLMKNISTFF
ncbi:MULTISPECIES: aromatic-ring-hydroxylating dioxygenase subunit beta [Microbacterium]|uniref:3-phenylpropionate/cinnamic acid dioxygenase, small subunit n=1 Tax=Microbacterium saccharophilum TaxID=1213358 RepID=A0A7Z7GEM3_9MICO|nr:MULTISPECIES: 3-phenylpropionate/cinnamic acid dioxygenase subunit beta [Microbacterium]SFI78204.1 3-phenylpropionate/cinnamic acid dioxygenase, small subunit [Microbacterium saccharophilum]